MNFNLKQQQPDNSLNALVGSKEESFNFESWAKAVRPQLLAVVQKRMTDVKR